MSMNTIDVLTNAEGLRGSHFLDVLTVKVVRVALDRVSEECHWSNPVHDDDVREALGQLATGLSPDSSLSLKHAHERALAALAHRPDTAVDAYIRDAVLYALEGGHNLWPAARSAADAAGEVGSRREVEAAMEGVAAQMVESLRANLPGVA